jgi:hypothetical protein
MACQSTWAAAAYRLRVVLVVVVSERRAPPGLRTEGSLLVITMLIAKLESTSSWHVYAFVASTLLSFMGATILQR